MGTSASISLETQVFRTEWLVTFPAVLHSSQPSSKILRSCFFFFFFFREELDCTTPDLHAFIYGLLPGGKEPRVSSFLQNVGWRTLDTNERTVLVFGGAGFWIKSSAMAVSKPCFRSLFCFPHHDLLSSGRIIFYCNISPLKSPALISHLNPKCKDITHQTVRWRTSGSSSQN